MNPLVRPAMTLIELLAALVILSAVAAAAGRTLQEASESARSSALTHGAVEALRLCPDLHRAMTGGAREDERWPREIVTADGRRWRVRFELPPLEADPPAPPPPSDLVGFNAQGLEVEWADVVVETAPDQSGDDTWVETLRFESAIPRREPGPSRNPRRTRRHYSARAVSSWGFRGIRGFRRGMTLIETLASLAILSMLAGVVGAWTNSTLRLQGRIAAAGPDALSLTLAALRDDLDGAMLTEDGPLVRVTEDGDWLEVVAPPRGVGLGASAAAERASGPSWRAVRWSVDQARGALVRTELGPDEVSWRAVEGVSSLRVELLEPEDASARDRGAGAARVETERGARPVSVLVTISWAEASRGATELRWEAAP